MIESIMLVGLGFLLAGLFMLMLAPLVHERAVRLTTRSILATSPLSMAEIQSDKDRLRAAFAMSTRRLELSIEELKAKKANQLAEIGTKTAQINCLKVELDKKSATILALRAREQVRKSITRRIVKLLLFIFIRSGRRRGRIHFNAKHSSHPVCEQHDETREEVARDPDDASVQIRGGKVGQSSGRQYHQISA